MVLTAWSSWSARAAEASGRPVGSLVHGRVFADDQVGDESCPARLVGSAESGAGVAMEVFVEEDEVAPGRVLLWYAVLTEDRSVPVGVAQEEPDQAIREVGRDLVEVLEPT